MQRSKHTLPKLGSNEGFTLVELMIATAVFATVLLVCTAGMLQIGRTYSKGITSTRTQEAARAVVDELSQAIQFGPGRPAELTDNGPSNGYCAGGRRFSFIPDRQLTESISDPTRQSRNVLVMDTIGSASCTSGLRAVDVTGTPLVNPSPGPLNDPRELLSTRMRVVTLSVTQVPPGDPLSDLYEVKVRVVTGDDELLEDVLKADGTPGTDGVRDTCRNQGPGSQFCAASELTTVVQKRVR